MLGGAQRAVLFGIHVLIYHPLGANRFSLDKHKAVEKIIFNRPLFFYLS